MWLSVNLGYICFKSFNKVLKSSVTKSSLIPFSVGGVSKTLIATKTSDNKNLGHTTILWQDGSDMQELPVIVRKIRGKEVMLLYQSSDKNGGKDNLLTENSASLDSIENGGKNFMNNTYDFSSCISVPEVFKFLENIPEEDVQPRVACEALRRIINLENNKTFRNKSMRLNAHRPKENFTRTALFNQLIEIIAEKGDNITLLETLRVLNRDSLKKMDEKYMNILSDELLIRSADGKFDIAQICEIIKIFSSISNGQNVDKLWIGIAEDSDNINELNIMDVFRSLLYLKDSQTVILNILEKKLPQLWSSLSGCNIAEILRIFAVTSLNPGKVFSSVTKWTHVNLESAFTEDVVEILKNLQTLDFNHKTICTSLENLLTVRKEITNDELLMIAVADYCLHFRVRSPVLLQSCADFIINNGRILSALSLKSVFLPIGVLNYYPTNSRAFWKVLEIAFNDKFVNFCPEDILEILLNCVYLEKYPLNFSNKIFNPFFLDRLHSTTNIESIERMRKKLRILDCVMNLECKHYQGPLLPNDKSTNRIWIDPRVKKALNQINSILSSTLSNFQQLSVSVFLPQLPALDFFIIDALISQKSKNAGKAKFNLTENPLAVLIHLPEHYCFQSNDLIGSQVMKKRVLKKLGLRVLSLDYSRLAILNLYPKKLVEYVTSSLKNIESAPEPL